jgi:hypothetical protein
VAVGCANSWFHVLDSAGKTRWKRQMQHKASAIGVADVDGDGFQDLLCGYTYQARQIVDFSKTGWDQVRSIGGCISGCRTITAGDVDGDGRPEAIFGDKDGRVLASRKGPPYRVDPVFQVMLGDDELTRVVARDLDGDGKAEVVCASLSNVVAAVDGAGRVRWAFPTDAEALDVSLGSWPGVAGTAVAVGTAAGRLHVLDAAGREVARETLGGAVSRVWLVGAEGAARAVAAVGSRVVAVQPAGK